MPANVVAVVTVAYWATDGKGLCIALDALLKLALKRVIVACDRKGQSHEHAKVAVEAYAKKFDSGGKVLELLEVDEDDTAFRWKHGILRAFEDQSVDAVFVFPGDFREEPGTKTFAGWQGMLARASRQALVLGDYSAKTGTFKGEFENLVGWAAVDVFFPTEAARLKATGLRRLRTEFFVIGRAVLQRARASGVIWTFDPTTDLALSCLRAPDLTLDVLNIEFRDDESHRDSMGQMFQLTRFSALLALNYLRSLPKAVDPADQATAYSAARARLAVGFDRLLRSIDRNHPGSTRELSCKRTCDVWREELMKVSSITDREALDRALPGRAKYDPKMLQALPFEGISVIHNVDPREDASIRFAHVIEQLRSSCRGIGELSRKIAFVASSSVHATTFDLINKSEHEMALRQNGYSYQTVREKVERTAVEWLRSNGIALKAKVEIVGVGMFAPNVLKLDLRLSPVAIEVFQAFRLALHAHLGRIDGYEHVRPSDWNRQLSAHLTLAYIVQPMSANEIDGFLSVLEEVNRTFSVTSFDLTQGEVTAFSDMDHYLPV